MRKSQQVAALLQTARRYDAMFETLLDEGMFEQAKIMHRNASSCRDAALAIQSEPEATPEPEVYDVSDDDGDKPVTVREASPSAPGFAIPPKPEDK